MACGYKYIKTFTKKYLYVEVQLSDYYLTHPKAMNGELEIFVHLTNYMRTVLNMVISKPIF